MDKQKLTSKILFAVLAIAPAASGQANALSRERLIKYTAENPYERFADGRPKVPDALLEKVSAEMRTLAIRPHHFACLR